MQTYKVPSALRSRRLVNIVRAAGEAPSPSKPPSPLATQPPSSGPRFPFAWLPRRVSCAAMADPESEPQPQPSVRLDKLSLDDLFKRTEALEAAGMSREAAKLAITSSKLITEWTVAGPFEGLEVKLSKVDQSVQSLQSTVFVLTVLVVFALCCLDFTTLENNIIGMLLKSVFSL